MRNKKVKANPIVNCLIAALALLFSVGRAHGQTPPPPFPGAPSTEIHVQSGPVGGFSVAMSGNVEVVKGHGYQADAVTETVQTLADGSHISHKMVATVARDAEGRTMRTETLDGMGLWGSANDKQVKITMVFDPVAGTHTHWESNSKTATVMPMPHMSGLPAGPAHFNGAEAGVVISGSFSTEDVVEGDPMSPKLGPETVFFDGVHTKVHSSNAASSDETTEQLGTRIVEGVEAVGTRMTQVIPAGTIGNDKDLVSTRETWFSPELKVVVSSVRNDPRFGQIRYTLNNIQVSEPNPSLFQPPAGYTLLRPRAPGA